MMESHRDSEYTYRTVGMVGSSSFCLVLPKDYTINLGVAKGDPVRVRLEEGRIVIEKAKKGKKRMYPSITSNTNTKKAFVFTFNVANAQNYHGHQQGALGLIQENPDSAEFPVCLFVGGLHDF